MATVDAIPSLGVMYDETVLKPMAAEPPSACCLLSGTNHIFQRPCGSYLLASSTLEPAWQQCTLAVATTQFA